MEVTLKLKFLLQLNEFQRTQSIEPMENTMIDINERKVQAFIEVKI